VTTGPLVSAIVPTYNRAGLVVRAIDSVLNQSYKSIEIIVVDDGSEDDTQVVLRRYGDRIKLLALKNSGPSAARNRGIEASQGEIIAFLDSDDIWLPNKLERQVDLLERAGQRVSCCLCNVTLMLAGGRSVSSFDLADINFNEEEAILLNAPEVLAARSVQFNQGVAVRRDVLERIGGFNEDLWCLEDYDLALRFSLTGKWALIREPLAIWYEASPGSLREKAMSEDVRLAKCYIETLERALSNTRCESNYANMRRQLRWQISSTRWLLQEFRLKRLGFRGAPVVSGLFRMLQRLRKAAYRRSPWFPRVRAVPLSLWA